MKTQYVNFGYPIGQQGHLIPLPIRIFYNDTIYWISARVNTQLTWSALLGQLLKALHKHHDIKLPLDPATYYVFNMYEEEALSPTDPVVEALDSEIIFMHQSEFERVLDKRRRAILVARMVRSILPPGDRALPPPHRKN